MPSIAQADRSAWQRLAAAGLARILDSHPDPPCIAWTVGPASSVVVGKVSGLELGERDSISITQALTLSGGVTRDANRNEVRVLRPIENTNRRAEIDINLKRVLEGKDNDFPLLPNDLLYVSHSYKRAVWTTLGALALQTLPVTLITLILR